MDTTKKGDELEDKIYSALKDSIDNDSFYAKKDCCKIYQKKGYYSKDRKSEIIFDIAIEIYLPGKTTFSLLTLIECKNYQGTVPVGDIENFYSKCQQVSGGNIKGIVASNSAFQKGTFNFAKSKGMGLLRYFDRNELEWTLTRSPSSLITYGSATTNEADVSFGLHNEDYKSKYFDLFGYSGNKYTNSIHLFIASLLKYDEDLDYIQELSQIETIPCEDKYIVKFLKEEQIEVICNDLLTQINYEDGEVPLEKICFLLKQEHNLQVIETSKLGDGVLGEISFTPPEIKILKGHQNNARKRFTLAHEIGHFILKHANYMARERCLESSIDQEDQKNIGLKDVARMEWQANQFASYLLLPSFDFFKSFKSIAFEHDLRDKGFGLLYVDNQKCNKYVYFSVTSRLMNKYSVSREAIKIRLMKLGYIKEQQF